jgi:hypothetical protein
MIRAIPLLLMALLASAACTNAGSARLSPAPYDVHAHNRHVHAADPTGSAGFNRVILHGGEQAAATIQRHKTAAPSEGIQP